jgi:hypothetical protein
MHRNFPQHSFYAWLDFIPKRAKHWGKLRIPDGDSTCCAAVVDPLSLYGKRNSSFIRGNFNLNYTYMSLITLEYDFEKDANENHQKRPVKMVPAFGYG